MTALLRVAGLIYQRGWWVAMLGVLLSAITLAASVGLLGLSGWFIAASGLAGVAVTAVGLNLFTPSSGIRFFALTRTVGRYLERLVTHDVTLRGLNRLREKLFLALSARPADQLARMRSTVWLNRLTRDLEALDGLYIRLMAPFVGYVLVTVGLSTLLWWLATPWIAGVLLISALLAACLIPLAVARQTSKPVRRAAHALEAMKTRSIDLTHRATDLSIYGGLKRQARRVDAAVETFQTEQNRVEQAEARGRAVAGFVAQAALAAAVLIASIDFTAGLISGPIVLLVVLSVFALLEPTVQLSSAAGSFGRLRLSARRVLDLMRPNLVQPSPVSSPMKEPASLAQRPQGVSSGESNSPSVVLKVEQVGYTHRGASLGVLSDISFNVTQGERLALVGASGSGKSTLLALMADLLAPSSGSITTAEETKGENRAATRCGFLSQRFDLFAGSVGDNLRLGAPEATDEQMWHALAVAGLDQRIAIDDSGLDRRLGPRGEGLSGGEARRLALARVLLAPAKLILMDEPTENIDAERAQRIMQSLDTELAGKTLVIATHRALELDTMDRALILENGRLVGDVSQSDQAAWNAVRSHLRQD